MQDNSYLHMELYTSVLFSVQTPIFDWRNTSYQPHHKKGATPHFPKQTILVKNTMIIIIFGVLMDQIKWKSYYTKATNIFFSHSATEQKYTDFQTMLEPRWPIAETPQQTGKTPQFDSSLKYKYFFRKQNTNNWTKSQQIGTQPENPTASKTFKSHTI